MLQINPFLDCTLYSRIVVHIGQNNHLSGPRHLENFIMTPNAHPSIGTLQKRMPTLTRTATH
jgi:hypothetical protein